MKNKRQKNRKFLENNFFLRKNRRGNIPITILVLGVLLICGLALLSFSFSIGEVNELSAVSALEKIKIQEDKIQFYKNLKVSVPENDFDFREDNRGRKYLFIQEKNIEVWFYLQ